MTILMTPDVQEKSLTHVQKQKWYDLCFGTTRTYPCLLNSVYIKKQLWSLVSQAARFSPPPWPGSLLPCCLFLMSSLKPVNSQGLVLNTMGNRFCWEVRLPWSPSVIYRSTHVGFRMLWYMESELMRGTGQYQRNAIWKQPRACCTMWYKHYTMPLKNANYFYEFISQDIWHLLTTKVQSMQQQV